MTDAKGSSRQGVKPDEQALWNALLAGEQPRYAGERLGIAPRRVEYLCLKWARKRVYSYGVVHDLGWAEPNAKASSSSETAH